MFRIDFYNHEVLNGKAGQAVRFSYYVCATELPVVLAEWLVTPGAISEIVAAVSADTNFTTWYCHTDSADFPRIAIRPTVPVT